MKRAKTSGFLLELPLSVPPAQVRRVRAHLEVARHLYSTRLGEARARLTRMHNDPAWKAACDLPRSHTQQRAAAFSCLRSCYGCSEYAMHVYAKGARCTWIAEHIDSIMAQTLASRVYAVINRLTRGEARHVRFKSKGRGIDSVEGKRNDTGMHFVLQRPEQGNAGYLLWGQDHLAAIIDWGDRVIKHGLDHPIKYIRLVRRKALSPQAKGAASTGHRYSVQLVLEGAPYQKKKHRPGSDTIGLDIGPSSLAIFPREARSQLLTFCEEMRPDARKQRCLQRKMDRQRRANNSENYDEKGRIKKQGEKQLQWKTSRRSLQTRRQYATAERKLAAHRKSLHGKLVNGLVRVGNHIQIEKTPYKGWQKQFGKSVGLRAPGMFVAHLKRIVAKTGGTLCEVPTFHTKVSRYCQACHTYVKKPLSQRWHHCPCGIGPVQRDVYSAFLLSYMHPPEPLPSITHDEWAGVESHLKAVVEVLQQRAKERQPLPQSFGISGVRARRPKSPQPNQHFKPASAGEAGLKCWGWHKNPASLER